MYNQPSIYLNLAGGVCCCGAGGGPCINCKLTHTLKIIQDCENWCSLSVRRLLRPVFRSRVVRRNVFVGLPCVWSSKRVKPPLRTAAPLNRNPPGEWIDLVFWNVQAPKYTLYQLESDNCLKQINVTIFGITPCSRSNDFDVRHRRHHHCIQTELHDSNLQDGAFPPSRSSLCV